LLLLDEPFASLDLALRRKLLPFLRRIRSEFRIPMLFVSHDPLEVQALCDDLIVLKDGETIAHGEPREVLRQVLTDSDIFSLAEQHGFENILACRLVENHASTSRVRLGEQHQPHTHTVEFTTMRAEAQPGDLMLASIPANDIIIATHKPEGLSARNIVPARITQLRSVGLVELVTAEIAAALPPLTIEVTETSFVELGLQIDCQIFLVIKATSCRLYAGEQAEPGIGLN
jgi:molybdate transport system ATP-binding protein